MILYTVIHFCSGFSSTETSLETLYGFDILKFRSQKIPESTPKISVGRKKILYNSNNFGLKTRNFGFQKHEVSRRKHEVSFTKTRSFGSKNPKFWFEKPEVSVQNAEVSGKIFEHETSVKVVFRNALVAEIRNFELPCTIHCWQSTKKTVFVGHFISFFEFFLIF
jgi:hypothetical protein